MDLRMSREMKKKNTEEALRKIMKTCVKRPDLTVNEAIVKFCSTSSSDALEQHLSKTKQQSYPVDDWLKDLAEKLADLSGSVKPAGLGALAFTIFIDIISIQFNSILFTQRQITTKSTKEALRCVFAEQKASEVWHQIDECLKRCMMHTNDDAELINNIRRIEHQLSAALTKLKSSMMRDGQMSSRALRAWVNGAAFHIQVRIHLVRLGGLQTCGHSHLCV
ncbi:coagulation factor XIII A1 polypeptide [Sarotherodon galilaeus]